MFHMMINFLSQPLWAMVTNIILEISVKVFFNEINI
jgi:hypothetical protein